MIGIEARLEGVDLRPLVRELYRDLNDGYLIPTQEERAVRAVRGSPVYGEITPTGAQRLIEYLELTERDAFFDLGAGVGKLVLQIAMSVPVARCVGVELSETRCRSARSALRRARRRGLVRAVRCSFRCQDLMQANLAGATVVYCCSTAFSIRAMSALAKKLRSLKRPLTFVTLQEFARLPRGFNAQAELRVATNWHRRTPAYIYRVT